MSDLYQYLVWSCAAYIDGEQRVLVVDDAAGDPGPHVTLSMHGDSCPWSVRLSPAMARGLGGALIQAAERAEAEAATYGMEKENDDE